MIDYFFFEPEAAEVMLQTAYVNGIIIILKIPLEFFVYFKINFFFFVLTFLFLSDPVHILCSLYYDTYVINVRL